MTLLPEDRKTEVWTGADEIVTKSLAVMKRIRSCYDLCTDTTGPSTVTALDSIRNSYMELMQRGVQIRFITEVTKDNLEATREVMKFAEVRHLDKTIGNFTIADRTDYAGAPETRDGTIQQLIVSNESAFVRQQQYFFNMLWEKSIPARQRIKEIEEGIPPQLTDISYGSADVMKRSLKFLENVTQTLDLCGDSNGPAAIVAATPVHERYIALHKSGVRIRHIVEITNENASLARKMTEFGELRHLDGLKGYFAIADSGQYASNIPATEGGILSQVIVSTAKGLVEQQQYFFDMLWNKAMPAEQRLLQLEQGIEPERTEVWDGQEYVTRRSLEVLSRATKGYDHCVDEKGPAIIATFDVIKQAYNGVVARGGKIRLITEVTSDNLDHCKEIMQFLELRHMNGIKGNFGIVDGIIYGGIAETKQKTMPAQYVHSNVKQFVEQQKYFFNMLWEKAIPIEERISQLEKGVRPRTIEVIHDTRASIGRAFDIMNSTKTEYNVLFASARTFVLAAKMDVAKSFADMTRRGVVVRVLVPNDFEADGSALSTLSFYTDHMVKTAPSVELKISDANIRSRISFLVSDRSEMITWELKDDTKDDPYEAAGVAVYSNIEALAISYSTIFENLWKVTDLTDNLRTTNIRLEDSQRAMKEFINVAAHELRTPIQPILGLSQILHNRSSSSFGHNADELLEVIERNAERLDRLAEDILDVARIESGTMRLRKENVDLWEVVLGIADDIKMSSARNNIKVVCARETPSNGSMIVNVDPNRISQVMHNLLSNALKFTSEGEISIKLGLAGKDENRNMFASVTVSDTGSGIDPAILPRLFEKFVTNSQKGTGLGLFISRGIIEAHGGRIWAMNNEVGKGASFTFTVPLCN